MARWGNVDFSELKELQKRIQELEEKSSDKFCETVSKELAARLLSLVIKRTPVGEKPELKDGEEKYIKATGTSGKSKKFLSPEAARIERYWGGYTGGTLRRGWTAETEAEAKNGHGSPSSEQIIEYARSLSIEKSGNYYIVRIVNPVEYASYVEFGHRQTPGRYVSALGKRLKQDYVDGQYMLKISEEELDREAPRLIEKKLDQMLQEVFNG